MKRIFVKHPESCEGYIQKLSQYNEIRNITNVNPNCKLTQVEYDLARGLAESLANFLAPLFYAKDTVLLVMPDYMLAYAQQKSGLTNEDLKLVDEILKRVDENANKTIMIEGNTTYTIVEIAILSLMH